MTAEVRSNLKYRHGDLKEQKAWSRNGSRNISNGLNPKYHRMPTEDEIAIAMEDAVPDNWIASIEEMMGDGDADGSVTKQDSSTLSMSMTKSCRRTLKG
jgi:hypothetical protein